MRRHKRRWPKGTWMKLKNPATLRGLMEDRGFSYADVASFVGCHRSFIGALCSTNPKHAKRSCSPRVATRIAEVLHVPVDVLFDPETSPGSSRSVPTQRKQIAENGAVA